MKNDRCSYRFRTLRVNPRDSRQVAAERFDAVAGAGQVIDARFVDAEGTHVAAWLGDGIHRPILRSLGAIPELLQAISSLAGAETDWAIVEQGNHKVYKTKASHATEPAIIKEKDDNARKAAAKRTIGIILGSACVVGFEIVAFF